MIYLDVTGGCTLALQTGIPRTTRELYRLTHERLPDLMPVRWQPFRGAYTQLSRRARQVLENRAPPSRSPCDTTGPLLLAAARDLAPPWPRAVPLHRHLRAADTLVLASLFPDNRLGCLEGLLDRSGRRVAVFHDAIPLRDPRVPAWEKRRHLRALRLLARFDLVVAVSNTARDDLLLLAKENSIAAPRTLVVRWPVPFSSARPPFTFPNEPTTVLCVSRLKQMKNHAVLLSGCERLWREGYRFSLELIGCEDEPRESAAVLAEVRRLAAQGRAITWRAQVSEEKLHEAYRQASFTVFPSLAEGFGLPIIESCWHGRGVICSGEAAMGETSRGPGAIHADVSQPAAIAAAMRPLLEDAEARGRLAREAYARPVRTWDDYWAEFAPCLTAA